MIISSKEKICGIPSLKVRKFLQLYGHGDINLKSDFIHISEKLNLPVKRVINLIKELEKEGYLEYTDDKYILTKTQNGRRLSGASAAKPITRKTAEKAINELLKRANEINKLNKFAFHVKKITLFGSYISDKEFIGDIDIIVELENSTKDINAFQTICNNRIEIAKLNGRCFSYWMQEELWPYNEVLYFLKNHKRSLSFHSTVLYNDLTCESKVIFEKK